MPKSSLPPITGDQAREARKSLRASQAEVASAIGLPRPTYSLFESGRFLLSDNQQQRLRAFLGDSLPEPDDDDQAEADEGQPSTRRRQPAVSTRRPARQASAPRRVVPVDDPEPETPIDQAGAALDELRELAKGPGGARNMRCPQAIEDAESALEALDYSELLDLAEEREVILPKDLPDVDALHRMDRSVVVQCETSVRALLICKALYGPHLQGYSFEALDGVQDQLRQALPKEEISTGRKTDWFGDDEPHGDAHLRRASLAQYIVQAAKMRAAPIIDDGKTRGA